MADFGQTISTRDFLYTKDIVFTNTTGEYKNDLIVKLILTDQNFNFDLIKTNGADFRLLQNDNTLRMWQAFWSYTRKFCVMFFKLQNLAADETITLKAYWGNSDAELHSEPDKLGLIFYEEFDESPLSGSIWSGGDADMLSKTIYDEIGYIFDSEFSGSYTNYLLSLTSPLTNRSSWVLEAGIYCDFTNLGNSGYAAMSIEFVGSEGSFIVRFNRVDSIDHNATSPTGVGTSITQTHGGLEDDSYNEIRIAYNETLDRVEMAISNRLTYNDITATAARKIEGDTRINNIKVWGCEYYYSGSTGYRGPYPSYISWLAIREYDNQFLDLGTPDLYIAYVRIDHELQRFISYDSNVILPIYEVISDFGGNPYLALDETADMENNVWVSNDDATSESEVSITMHTAWTYNITNRNYIHYDSGHVYYYNAAKISDGENDIMGRNYFEGTSSESWVCIKFDYPTIVGAFRVKPHTSLSSCPKNYSFYGSNYNPNLYFNRAVLLHEGTFLQSASWQAGVFSNYETYKYYILHIHDTYGGSNVKIQEWQLFQSLGLQKRRVISQIRLTPALYSYDYMAGFPEEICLQGSNDTYIWENILDWTYTYTPFVIHLPTQGYEQRYSFTNEKQYWSFKLLMRGNWGRTDGKIILGTLGLHELSSEVYTHRILKGTSNNIQQIWSLADTNIDGSAGRLFVTNDYLSVIIGDKLINYEQLPSLYHDLIVT